MAIINKIKLTAIENFKDLSPEFYKPSFMERSAAIRRINFRRFSQISYITDGEHGSPCWSDNSGIKYVTAEFIKENFIAEGIKKQITVEQDKRNARARLREGDILIYSVGAYAGLSCVAEPHLFPANIPRSVAIVRLNNFQDFLPEFISVFLNSDVGNFQAFRFRAGNSQPVLALEKIRQFEIPIIDLNSQEQIKKLYNEAYNCRRKAQQYYDEASFILGKEFNLEDSYLDNLPNKYHGGLNEVVLGKRFDPEYYNPRTKIIVEKIRSLNHTIVSKHFHIKNGFPWFSKRFLPNNTGVPVVRIRDIRPNFIDIAELTSIEHAYAKSIKFPKANCGDIVIGMDGLKYFYASILEDECMVNQRVCHLTAKANSKLSSEFVTFFINSKFGQSQLLRDMTIATTVGHITNLNVGRLIIPIVSDIFHQKITLLIRDAIDLQKRSKQLLAQAKTSVEQLIHEAAIN